LIDHESREIAIALRSVRVHLAVRSSYQDHSPVPSLTESLLTAEGLFFYLSKTCRFLLARIISAGYVIRRLVGRISRAVFVSFCMNFRNPRSRVTCIVICSRHYPTIPIIVCNPGLDAACVVIYVNSGQLSGTRCNYIWCRVPQPFLTF
jgi:hypothetical protein